MSAAWTLDQLVAKVREDLAALDLAQVSGRVSESPDARTIRYYGTLGIIDRPLGTRRRRKLYGERHRQQLIAIKRLQARGLALDTIQATMLSISPAELADLAGAERSAPVPASAPTSGAGGRDRPFWTVQPPAASASPTSVVVDPQDEIRAVAGVQLGPLTLSFAASRSPSPDDVAALAALTGPLLEALEQRGLLAPSSSSSSSSSSPSPPSPSSPREAAE